MRRTARNTGVAVITVVDGDNRIILDEGANGEVTVSDVEVLLSDAQAGDIFMTQLENPLLVVEAALALAKEKGLFTLFNPAPAKEAARSCVKYADLITPNETELRILSGKEGIEEGCAELLNMGFTVPESAANFLFAGRASRSGEEIYQRLKDAGVLVRFWDKPVLRDFVRITVGTREENTVLLEKLKNILS